MTSALKSIYLDFSEDKITDLLSQFLINSWSYSKVSEFARNEKAFEMSAIYGQYGKSSATTVAGQAYHFALDRFFKAMQQKKEMDLVFLENIAYEYIEDFAVQLWKIQKTTPTVQDCKLKATETVTKLLRNFFAENSIYLEEIADVLDVEVYCDEWLNINGVDIPLPCHCRVDLVVKLTNGKIVIIDHKSKSAFSDEQEIKLSIGVQAITYVKCIEQKYNMAVDEIWFMENKHSKNKDGSKQILQFKIEITDSVKKIYEVILYDPLKRMIAAVNDPDYVYIINDSDNFVDKAEIYDFYMKTMIAEVDEFNVDPSKKALVAKRLKKIRDASTASINPNIIKKFKENASAFIHYDFTNKNMTQEEKIEHVLRSFGVIVRVAHKFDGYSSNTYLLEVSAGVKITSVMSHRLDIANALNVSNVRIANKLVVHDKKSHVGIEFSKKREHDLLFDPAALVDCKLPIGKDNFGNTVVWDLNNHSTPHALVCGATGSGKSVLLRALIEYAKLANIPVIVLDPKFEFGKLKDVNVSVYQEIDQIEAVMKEMVKVMNVMVKDGYERKTLIIFDEFADAVASSKSGAALKIYEDKQIGMYANGSAKFKREHTDTEKSLEENLRILVQKGRSVGIRVLAATQRASVKVITGDAKANFPVQICFAVPKEADSRVVLDEAGAEALSGKGDGLIKSPEYKDTVRFQAFYKP